MTEAFTLFCLKDLSQERACGWLKVVGMRQVRAEAAPGPPGSAGSLGCWAHTGEPLQDGEVPFVLGAP